MSCVWSRRSCCLCLLKLYLFRWAWFAILYLTSLCSLCKPIFNVLSFISNALHSLRLVHKLLLCDFQLKLSLTAWILSGTWRDIEWAALFILIMIKLLLCREEIIAAVLRSEEAIWLKLWRLFLIHRFLSVIGMCLTRFKLTRLIHTHDKLLLYLGFHRLTGIRIAQIEGNVLTFLLLLLLLMLLLLIRT